MHIYTANWNWALTLLFLHSLCVVFSDRLIKNDPYPFFQNLICIWSRSVFMLRTLLGEDTSNWFYDSQLLSLQSSSPPSLPSLFLPSLPPLLHFLSVPSPLLFSIHFSLFLSLTFFPSLSTVFSGLRQALTVKPRP